MNIAPLLELIEELEPYGELRERLGAEPGLQALGLPTAAHAPVMSQIVQDWNRPVLLLVSRIDQVPIWQQALESWLPEDRQVLRLPEPTPLPFDRGPWSQRTIRRRLRVLTTLMAGQHPLLPKPDSAPIIIASYRAAAQKTMPRQQFTKSTRVLTLGSMIDLEKQTKQWLEIGYSRVSVVEQPGQFSRRGGILDLYPISASLPVRIELFGDEIDTMREFDPSTQRTTDGELKRKVLVTPAREALPQLGAALGAYLESEAPDKVDDLPAWQDDIPALLSGEPSPNMEFYLPMMYGRPALLLDYLPSDTLVLVDQWPGLAQSAQDLMRHGLQIKEEQESLPPDYPSPLAEWDEFAANVLDRPVLVLGHHQAETNEANNADTFATDGSIDYKLADHFLPGPRYGGQMRPFTAQLRHAQRDRETTVVVSRQALRLSQMWRQELREENSMLEQFTDTFAPRMNLEVLPGAGAIRFIQGSLAEGFLIEDVRTNKVVLNVLTDAEIFGWRRPAPQRRRRQRPTAPETPFADITPGDYVVHLEHGVGQFLGLVVRSIGGTEREYLRIQYRGSDSLYVPVHHADRLSKWIGPEGGTPPTQRLGDKVWKNARTRAMRSVSELADELIELYSAREMIHGHAFGPDSEWQHELEATFPYQETEDQLSALAAVKEDMERARPMDRLICGDVGYGKTEVALRAAFKAVMDGKQVGMLVPTTVLAQQHYNTFYRRLTNFPVNVAMLSRFRTQSQQQTIVKKLREGEIDIVIGTHRMLSNDVSFKDLGLLIVDEEQRFGVGHKERLKQLRTEVDVLTMTATPIPRTMYMSLSGVRDISIINTAPAERLPVQTYVGEMDESLLKRAMLRELDRGGQVFIVHNRVMTIDIIKKQLQALVPDANIAVGHGQMAERQLEKIMGQFIEGEIDILLSTTIIENGIDIPNANTLIVDRSENFGLSQLYQLRGRVGRGAQRAFSYFFHGPWRTLSTDARTRLEALAEHTELGSGYQLAMRDLEIRGAGELLGANQSGHIAAVGFDLYTKMLARAVKMRKAAQRGETIIGDMNEDTKIDLPLATYIPPDYVADGPLRLRLYRRMAGLDTLGEIDAMAEELADRFGPIPDPIDHLLYQLRVKSLAIRAGISTITTEANQIRLRMPNLEMMDRMKLQKHLGNDTRVSKTAVWLSLADGTNDWKISLVQVLEKLAIYVRPDEPTPAD